MKQIRSVIGFLVVLALVGFPKSASAQGIWRQADDLTWLIQESDRLEQDAQLLLMQWPTLTWYGRKAETGNERQPLTAEQLWPHQEGIAQMSHSQRCELVVAMNEYRKARVCGENDPNPVETLADQLQAFASRMARFNVGAFTAQVNEVVRNDAALEQLVARPAQTAVLSSPVPSSGSPIAATAPARPKSIVTAIPSVPQPTPNPVRRVVRVAPVPDSAMVTAFQRERARANQLELENQRLRASCATRLTPFRRTDLTTRPIVSTTYPATTQPLTQAGAPLATPVSVPTWPFWVAGVVCLIVIVLAVGALICATNEFKQQNRLLTDELSQLSLDRSEQRERDSELHSQLTTTIDEIGQLRQSLANHIIEIYGIWRKQGFLRQFPHIPSDLRDNQLFQVFAGLQRTILEAVNERMGQADAEHRQHHNRLEAKIAQLNERDELREQQLAELKDAAILALPLKKLNDKRPALGQAIQALTVAAAEGGRLGENAALLAPLAELTIDDTLLVSRLTAFRRKR